VTVRKGAIALGLLAGALWASAADTTPEKLIVEGHWKRARAIVEARMREAPDDALANFLLSQIRNAFGDHETPLPLAEKAVAIDGAVAKYHRQVAEVLGVMAQHAGVWQQLMLARRFHKEIDTALMLDPRDIQALRDLMEFYLLAPGIAGGDEHKAAATADRIAAIDPMEGYLAQARLAEFQKQPGKGEEFLKKAAELQPSRYQPQTQLTQFYLSHDRFNAAAAEHHARAAQMLDPSRMPAYAALAEVYAEGGNWTELDSTLGAAAREVPDDLTPYYRAAERLLASGRDFPRAERYLRTYLSQEPEGNAPTLAEAHWKLGLVLEKQRRNAEAVSEWKEALKLDHASPAAHELKRVEPRL
jgi:tetratricopeptide (TPR) repeat protein